MTTTAPRRVYRTAQIKPATRDALKDVLAQAADEIIRLRTVVDGATFAAWEWRPGMSSPAMQSPWWVRAARRISRLWTGAR